jgi:dihydroxy-acid dehydratase
MVMGTASTMTSLAEALGMTLPGCANIPAVDTRRMVIAQQSGRRIVEMVKEELRPSQILTRAALENAIHVLMAIGGSTNAVIHLIALAGRLGIELSLETFDEISRATPFLANVKPCGRYLMEDLYYAGGIPALMREIADLLHLDALTVTGQPVGMNIATAAVHNREVIRPDTDPLHPQGGIAVLRGNLAPNGAVIKQTAASQHLMAHRGRALVFGSRAELLTRIDDPNLDVDANTVLVLQNAGPYGAPGMPEWGQLPIPKKLLDQGVTDIVRISDARMSGTSYGTVVLHTAPEAAIGGPLAIVRDGDMIELDVERRRLHLELSDAEIQARLASWTPPQPHFRRGYGWMFQQHVLQADQGCDFDFLRRIEEPADDMAARYALMGHS